MATAVIPEDDDEGRIPVGYVAIDRYKRNLVYINGNGTVYYLDPDHPHHAENISRMGKLEREILKAYLSANLDILIEIMYPEEKT